MMLLPSAQFVFSLSTCPIMALQTHKSPGIAEAEQCHFHLKQRGGALAHMSKPLLQLQQDLAFQK